MTHIISSFYQSLSSAFSYMFSSNEDSFMKETHSFGAVEWKKHLNIDIEEPYIPEKIQIALEKPCPFWSNKLVKETHVLCLIPKNISLNMLFNKKQNLFLEDSLSRLKIFTPCSEDSYWILMTKKPIPNTCQTKFEDQKNIAHQNGYDIPSILEAIISILSVNFIDNVPIYSQSGEFTRCKEELDGWPIAVGGSRIAPHFLIYQNDWNEGNGVAGVIR